MLGAHNVSGKSLHELELNRFAKASLFGKLANIYADLSDESLHRTGTFKMLTGGDHIEAEKKFRDPFTFVNYAKLLFSCNKLPTVTGDDTDAFFRRWIIVTFPNVFVGKNCDLYILEKLTTSEELSGFLNIALRGLRRLLDKKEFTYNKTTEEIREDYIRKSDPLGAFVMDCLEVSQEDTIIKQELYVLFGFYCRENSLPTVNRDTFFKNLPAHIMVTQVRLNRKDVLGRPYAFQGIKLSEKGLEYKERSNQSSQSTLSPILSKGSDETSIKMGKTLDSLDHTEENPLSKLRFKPRPFRLQDLIGIERVRNAYTGLCDYCQGDKRTIRYQAEAMPKGERGVYVLCEDCGQELMGRMRGEA